MKEIHWFNFADPRRPDPVDTRLESKAQSMGLVGPSSPLPSRGGGLQSKGGDGTVTVQEKKASMRGQAERGTQGGTSKDRCKKGKSCGATCIDPREDCIIDFNPDVNSALNSVRQYLSKRQEEGAITPEQKTKIQEDIENPQQYKKASDRVKAFREFGEMIREGKTTDAEKDFVARLLLSTTLTPGQDRNAARVLSYDEIDAITKGNKLKALEDAYNASFVKGRFDPSAPGGMGEYIQKNVLQHQISDAVAEKAYYMLPSKVRSAIDKAGAVNQMFAGYDKDGNPIYSSTPTRERGIFLVKRWGEQGGLDPYTGKPIDIRNAEPEHMVAYKHAQSKGGGGGDQPSNLTWSASQPNNNKAGAGDDFAKWREVLESNKALGKDKYNTEIYNPAAEKASAVKGRKATAPTDLEAALAASTAQQRVNTVKALMMTYGADFRYLMRAAGVGWQHQDRDLDHRAGGKPAFMDMDIPKLPGYKVKPSVAVMAALAAVEPSKRSALLGDIEQLRKSRIFSDEEAQSVRGDNDARLELKRKKSAEYADQLTKTLQQHVPSLGEVL